MNHLAPRSNRARPGRQGGVALPVMLIVLGIMLLSGAYLLKSGNTTTLTTSNLAYQSTLNRANDLALMQGSEWLAATWVANKTVLDTNNDGAGYVATYNPSENVRASSFWVGSKTITDNRGNRIEYVIHRLCKFQTSWNTPNNLCVQTAAKVASIGTDMALGASLSSTAAQYAENPKLHYVITARIYGPRGGNVVSQLAVLMAV